MTFQLIQGGINKEKADVAIFFVHQEEVAAFLKKKGVEFDRSFVSVCKEEKWEAKANQVIYFRSAKTLKRLIFVGLGKKKQITQETYRQAAATAFRYVSSWKAKKVFVDVPTGAIQSVTEGILLSKYKFTRYKKQKAVPTPAVTLFLKEKQTIKECEEVVKTGKYYAQATMFARDLVNTPGKDMKPQELVEAAKELAKGVGSISVSVYNKERLEKMGAGGILAVAQGSPHDPALVHMVYKPKKKAAKKVAIVGKAVTFDSGGLSLKPPSAMENMKVDMAGSASVLGVFSVLKNLSLNVEVHGIFAACENMPSGEAIRPGDVVQMLNKKTVEILNTDAEGRVTLADALVFANKQKPAAIIDLATLTGACLVALGEEVAGLMSNDKKLTKAVLKASNVSGEKMWELPLEKNYQKLLESKIADYKNIGGRWGGTLTAGLFLQAFVGKTPWVHLDIAGPSYAERPVDPYTLRGATGYGVRTLLTWLQQLS